MNKHKKLSEIITSVKALPLKGKIPHYYSYYYVTRDLMHEIRARAWPPLPRPGPSASAPTRCGFYYYRCFLKVISNKIIFYKQRIYTNIKNEE